MIPVYQTKFGGSEAPEEDQGNCMAACLASIFELFLEDVPDFAGEITNGQWYVHLQRWLATMNLMMVTIPIDRIPAIEADFMVSCKSTTLPNPDDGHMVVASNGRVVHNPRADATSIGAVIDIWLLVPLDLPSQRRRYT